MVFPEERLKIKRKDKEMGGCEGYKRTCWMSKSSKSDRYCSSCNKQKFLDRLEQVDRLDVNVYPLIRTCIQYDSKVIETFLPKMLKENKKHFKDFFNYFEKTNAINIFTLRVRNHVGGELCQVYEWVLREKRVRGEWFPERCLYCQGNSFVWGRGEIRSKARRVFVSEMPDFFVRNAMIYCKDRPDDYERVMKRILYQILDNSYALYALIEPRIGNRELCKQMEYHPNILRMRLEQEGNPLTQIRGILREWIGMYKEELIAKTWHPTRLMTWCLDEEEKRELLD